MEHKAFAFDFSAFEVELLPILQRALQEDRTDELATFIDENIADLKDPYEGEALESDWRNVVEPDPHQYGDFALTKYYDPAKDIGLGADWESVKDSLSARGGMSPVLGRAVGAREPFDPGKMGAYFQSAADVTAHCAHLRALAPSAMVSAALDMLGAAARKGLGLYVTF